MADSDPLPWAPYPAMDDAARIAHARDFHEHIRTRRSCRSFSDRPVPREIIEHALRAAGSAPSGANHQPWHFAVLSSPETKAAVRIAAEEEERQFYAGRAGNQWLEEVRPLHTQPDKPFLETAPWLIVIFAQKRGGMAPGEDKPNYHVTESVSIAAGLMLSALHAAGLATLIHTPHPMRFLNRVCRRPDNERPAMIVVVGHPAEDATLPARALQRKPLEEISSWL